MPTQTASNAAKFFVEIAEFDEDELKVLRFNSTEGISDLFEIDVEIAVRDETLHLEESVGAPSRFGVSTTGDMRFFTGIATRIEYCGATRGHSLYRAKIVPRLWRLTKRTNCRIFQDMDAIEILEQICDEHNISGDDIDVDLSPTLEAREYCVQYRETDYEFVSRLLEEEGLFFYFDAGSQGLTLVVTNNGTTRPRIDGEDELRYAPTAGMVSEDDRDQVFDFEVVREKCHDGYVSRGYDIEQPHEMYETGERATTLQSNVFEPLETYASASAGTSITERRLTAIWTGQHVVAGSSNSSDILPGYEFDLIDHPVEGYDQPYHVLRATMRGASPQALEEDTADGGEGEFVLSFTAIPSTVEFVPPRRTPRPDMRGSQLGLVVGSENTEIETDEYGRVKVRFRWDQETEGDENSSCWIRVAQPWAGSNWGFLAIPRVGQEVVVDFLDGDPDKPIVVGSVYNGEQMPPQTLEQDKSRMTLRSQSLGGGGGFNEITLDDKENDEELFMQAERDMRQEVKHCRSRSVGADESVSIGGDRTRSVKGDESITVTGDRKVKVDKGALHKTKLKFERQTGQEEVRTVGKASTTTIGKDATVTIGGNHTLTVTGTQSRTIGKAMELVCTASLNETITGAITRSSDDSVTIEAKNQIVLETGSSSLTLKKDGTIELKGKTLKIGGSQKIELKSSGPVEVKGSVVKLNS